MPKKDGEEKVSSFLGVLALLPAGKATVMVGGHPLVSVDADSKSLEVEADGFREAGLRLSDVVRAEGGVTGVLQGSRKVTGTLSELGWKLTLCAEGDRLLTMGSGVSSLTGRVWANPLRLRKLLEVLG